MDIILNPFDQIKKTFQKQDYDIYKEIFVENSYDITSEEMRDNIVFDLGANIGMFTLFALENGAKKIISVEANPFIYPTFIENMKNITKIIPIHKAIYHVDGENVKISNDRAGSSISNDGADVSTVTLETLVNQYSDEKSMVLKLDCEGSEYNVILNTPKEIIRRFKVVSLELHLDKNINEKYRGKEIIDEKMISNGFEKIKDSQVYFWDVIIATGEKVNWRQSNTFIQKWIRKNDITYDFNKVKEIFQTQNRDVYKEIFIDNTYSITNEEFKDSVVFDFGANVGMFSVFALENNAKEIIAVEAHPGYYKTLVENLINFPEIKTVNKAIYSVDDEYVKLSDNGTQSTISRDGFKVSTITLETLTKQYLNENNMILKIDCEGAEYDMILNTQKEILRRFKIVACEIHAEFNIEEKYRGKEKIENKMIDFGFEKVNENNMFLWDTVIATNEILNYRERPVQKWIRKD